MYEALLEGAGDLVSWFISRVIIRVTPFRALITLLITYLLSPLPLQVINAKAYAGWHCTTRLAPASRRQQAQTAFCCFARVRVQRDMGFLGLFWQVFSYAFHRLSNDYGFEERLGAYPAPLNPLARVAFHLCLRTFPALGVAMFLWFGV